MGGCGTLCARHGIGGNEGFHWARGGVRCPDPALVLSPTSRWNHAVKVAVSGQAGPLSLPHSRQLMRTFIVERDFIASCISRSSY